MILDIRRQAGHSVLHSGTLSGYSEPFRRARSARGFEAFERHCDSTGGDWGGGRNEFIFLGSGIMGDYEGDGLHLMHANVLDSSTQSTNRSRGGVQTVLFYPWGQTWYMSPASSCMRRMRACRMAIRIRKSVFVRPQ